MNGAAFQSKYLNRNDYINGIPQETWEYYIGSYQPLQKWLKDRKGQTLTQADIEHYQQMIAAIEETQRIMQEIDEVIEL